AQERDNALGGGLEAEGSVRVGPEQLVERVQRTHDSEKGITESLHHRGFGFALERRFRRVARAEHDIPAREDGLHIREAGRLERLLQLGHLGVRRHDASEKRGKAWHGAEVGGGGECSQEAASRRSGRPLLHEKGDPSWNRPYCRRSPPGKIST